MFDEPDEMLAQRFRENIQHILTDLPKKPQTLLFSANVSNDILGGTSRFFNNPQGAEAANHLRDFYDFKSALIFSNKNSQDDSLTQQFKERGMTAEGRGIDISHIEPVFNFACRAMYELQRSKCCSRKMQRHTTSKRIFRLHKVDNRLS